jgi:hypothetical protein
MTTSLHIIPSAEVTSQPEFGDHHTCRALFNLPRSSLYLLVAEGKIRSVSLRKRGNKRGRRLFDCASIREYLRSLS